MWHTNCCQSLLEATIHLNEVQEASNKDEGDVSFELPWDKVRTLFNLLGFSKSYKILKKVQANIVRFLDYVDAYVLFCSHGLGLK